MTADTDLLKEVENLVANLEDTLQGNTGLEQALGQHIECLPYLQQVVKNVTRVVKSGIESGQVSETPHTSE